MSRFRDRILHPLLGFELAFVWSGEGLLSVGPVDEGDDEAVPASVFAAFPGIDEIVATGQTARTVRCAPLGSAFQRAVWARIADIPHGETISYRELAASLGLGAGAARAVGTACGRNPWPLIVPCHRVLASNGTLGGFIWGLPAKRRLLDAERPAFRLSA